MHALLLAARCRGFPAVTMHHRHRRDKYHHAFMKRIYAVYAGGPWFLPRDMRTEVGLSVLLMDADTHRHTALRCCERGHVL